MAAPDPQPLPSATPAAQGEPDLVCVERRQLQEIMRRARWIDRVAGALLVALGEGEPSAEGQASE